MPFLFFATSCFKLFKKFYGRLWFQKWTFSRFFVTAVKYTYRKVAIRYIILKVHLRKIKVGCLFLLINWIEIACHIEGYLCIFTSYMFLWQHNLLNSIFSFTVSFLNKSHFIIAYSTNYFSYSLQNDGSVCQCTSKVFFWIGVAILDCVLHIYNIYWEVQVMSPFRRQE